MKFSTKEDIGAPIGQVFDALSDFDGFERAALRRGADVQRTDALSTPAAGMGWTAKFSYRGRARQVDIRLDRFDRPTLLAFSGASSQAEGTLVLELMELSRNRTRLTVGLEVRPKTITARLFIQSLKLAKARVKKRFDARVKAFALDLEGRNRAA